MWGFLIVLSGIMFDHGIRSPNYATVIVGQGTRTCTPVWNHTCLAQIKSGQVL
ncbi:hypothetical protein HD806DRAFT_483473 [Xylariaceae sp. AK1471]|nr:hypothetical protein HD806DRAFT_483473 [Xylariaceae sp. AK1471]